MKLRLLLPVCLATVLQPAIASPEHPWLMELHTGLVGSSESISDADIDVGFEFGGSVSYHFIGNRIGPYLAWSVNAFDADSDAFPDLEVVVYRRLSLGISYQDLNAEGSQGFYVRAGVTSGEIRLEDDDDNHLADTDSGTGWEAMAGLTFNIKNNWGLRTGITYSSLTENLEDVSGDSNADIDAFSVNIGWSVAF